MGARVPAHILGARWRSALLAAPAPRTPHQCRGPRLRLARSLGRSLPVADTVTAAALALRLALAITATLANTAALALATTAALATVESTALVGGLGGCGRVAAMLGLGGAW